MTSSNEQLHDAANALLLACLVDTAKMYGDKSIVASVKEAAGLGNFIKEAAETDGNSDDNFDGWLPLRLSGTSKYYDYTIQELKAIRDVVRTTVDTNEVAKNVILHFRNFVIGRGITIDIYPEDLGDDPVALAEAKEDAQVRKMKSNWKKFCTANNIVDKLWEWDRRARRDGEVYVRIFKQDDVPVIRFIDPDYIKSNDPNAPYGIIFDESDAATIKNIIYSNPTTQEETPIGVEELVIDKRNVDETAPRGIPSFWPILTNLRRIEKILVNSSVLATVQAAITMVRKHENATGAKVAKFVSGTSDGVGRTDSNGKTIYSRKVRAGTVLDAPKGITYDFPSHGVDASSFVAIADHEMAHVANAFVLPVEWLLTKEPTDPLTPGSPVVANFEVEQEIMFSKYEQLFWKVQELMGVNVERNKEKYVLYFNGKRLAVGKALDEARVDEILIRNGATSPQEMAGKNGNNWTITRANMIKHRKTKQEGEAMPGDAGNTAPSTQPGNGGDGDTTKTNGKIGQRVAAGDGGKA